MEIIDNKIEIDGIEYMLVSRGRALDMTLENNDICLYEYISRVQYTDKSKEPMKRTTIWLARCKKCNSYFIATGQKVKKCKNGCFDNHGGNGDTSYQNRDTLYKMYIEDGMTRSDIAIKFGISQRTVDKWLTEINGFTEAFRNEVQVPNKIQEDIIIASLLGDGHIDKREDYPVFIVAHAENQKEYLYWKYDIFKKFCLHKPSFRAGGTRNILGKEYNVQNQYRLSTRSIKSFAKYREMSISDKISKLNDLSISVYVLDDGYLTDSFQWELCVAKFSEPEKEHFIEYCYKKFGISWYISNYDNRYIKLKVQDSKKLSKIILENIPNNLDIIKYKVLKGGGETK